MKSKQGLAWLLALSLLWLLTGVAGAQEGTKTVTFPVEGMV